MKIKKYIDFHVNTYKMIFDFGKNSIADTESYPYQRHDYKPKSSHPYSSIINAIKKDNSQITYKCDELNITVVLLIPEKGSHFYQDKGNLAAAFETYNTIISIN